VRWEEAWGLEADVAQLRAWRSGCALDSGYRAIRIGYIASLLRLVRDRAKLRIFFNRPGFTWRKKSGVSIQSRNFDAWLFTVARNLAIDSPSAHPASESGSARLQKVNRRRCALDRLAPHTIRSPAQIAILENEAREPMWERRSTNWPVAYREVMTPAIRRGNEDRGECAGAQAFRFPREIQAAPLTLEQMRKQLGDALCRENWR